jgi:nucleoside-diphosphate-sugar epimerase
MNRGLTSYVLLTGASGFIGTRVRTLLVKRGYRLRVLTRRPSITPSQIDSRMDYFIGDLTDASTCRRAMDNVNVFIHAAGAKRDATRFWPVNVQGTENLLSAAVDEGVGRFVHVSSVGVIGADPLCSKVFSEDAACVPRNAYERSKWEAERLVRRVGVEGLPVTVLRPANVFGDRDPERHLLTLARNVRDRRFVYLGGRDVICNYVFVEDVAPALLALAEHPSAVGRVYHLSDACTLGEFVSVLADELCVTRPSLQLPPSMSRLIRVTLRGMRRLPWLSNSSAFARLVSLNNQASFATSRLADELNFEYPVGWQAGLRRVVEWYRSQGEL